MRRVLASFAILLTIGCNQEASAPDNNTKRVAEAPNDGVQATQVARSVSPFPNATALKLFVDSGKYDREGQPIFTRQEGRILKPNKRIEFEAALKARTVTEMEAAACFIPHHFFRYYDSQGKLLGEISVCFCCAGISIDPANQIALRKGEVFEADYTKLDRLVHSLGEPTSIRCD